MKVIKPGREQKSWAKELKCTGKGNGDGGCGAVLLVEQGDLYITESFDLPHSEKHITFTCPQCQVETDVAFGTVPMSDLPGKRKWESMKKLAEATENETYWNSR